ncbi:MAG: hypothetical protein DMF77_13050 [Acidobacteria bacterium]|nr:MAG: hypothetical protein DMF77_13050 [Acidobacteriota bacterium]
MVCAGRPLAVRLPAEVVRDFNLRKEMLVEVSFHPETGVVTIRPGSRHFERGKATSKFEKRANELLTRRSKAYRALAK